MTPTRMLAVDIDGTMIRSDGSLSETVRRALHRAVDAGIEVVPATGRPEAVAADIIASSGLDGFWVFTNGAVTRHIGRNETVRGFWLDPEVALSAVSEIRRVQPELGYAIEFENTVAYESGFEATVFTELPVPPVERIETALESPPGRIQKLLVFDRSVVYDPDLDEAGRRRQWRQIDELFTTTKRAVGDRLTAGYSGLPFIELAAEEVTKARALALLADDFDIPVEAVVAVGDNHNDIPMLEWAGTGLAMANATDDAKAAADRIIGANDDDGLAVAVDELVDNLGG